MDRAVNIGIIGDYDANNSAHPATGASIGRAAAYLNVKAGFDWIPTPSLLTAADCEQLDQYDGLWISSGSPYLSMDGALNGIRYAREQDRPLFGT